MGKIYQECLQMFTGPVGPVEVFFYWPEAAFGNFYWPGAIGLPLASSPGYERLTTLNISPKIPLTITFAIKDQSIK